MFFDIAELDQRLSYKLLTATVVPRPIAWVVTLDATGVPNAAPFSFFNFFSGFPPVVCLGIGKYGTEPKDTLRHIHDRGEFVINLVPEQALAQMNITAIDFPPGHNELAEAGLSVCASSLLETPRIEASPVALECRLKQTVDIDTTAQLVIGHVVGVHVRDDAVINRDKCYIDTPRLELVGRMESPGWYTRTRDRLKLRQQSYAEWRPGDAPARRDESEG